MTTLLATFVLAQGLLLAVCAWIICAQANRIHRTSDQQVVALPLRKEAAHG